MNAAGYSVSQRRSPPPSQMSAQGEKHLMSTPSSRLPIPQGTPGNVRGWMSFEESPVHSQAPPGTQAQPKPTYGPVSTIKTDDVWTAFPDGQVKPADIPAGQAQGHMPQAIAMRTAVVQPLQKEMQSHPNVATVPPYSVPQMHVPAAVVPQYISSPASVTHPQNIPPSSFPLPNQQPQQQQVVTPQQPTPAQPLPVYTPSKPTQPQQNTHHPPKEQLQQTPVAAGNRGQRVPSSDDSLNEGHTGQNPWRMNSEQRQYYIKQFAEILPDLTGKIDGQTARNFFTKSRLPIVELSHIWELSDMDQDGHLNLDEFCAAFHLVVARKNGYDLPATLPQSLIPTLIDIGDGIVKPNATKGGHVGLHINQSEANDTHSKTSIHSKSPDKPKHETKPSAINNLKSKQKNAENWETFSERTSSATSLTNFDQVVEHAENMAHPVPTRITPSRQEAHSARFAAQFVPKSTDDGDSTPPQPSRVPAPHRSLTNPYDSLTNEVSEPDSSHNKGKRSNDRRLSSSSSSADNGPSQVSDPIETVTLCNDSDNDVVDTIPKKYPDAMKHAHYNNHRKPTRKRSASMGSSSSIASDHSSATDNSSHVNVPQSTVLSDQEHSDWSSRPLRPRSGSESSDSPSLQNLSLQHPALSAPTPPPRPNQSKSNSLDKKQSLTVTNNDIEPSTASAPTPPPRPQVQKPTKQNSADIPQETFADFSQFDKQMATDEPETTIDVEKEVAKEEKPTAKETQAATHVEDETNERPVPAPRHPRDRGKESSESDVKDDESSASEKLPLSKKKSVPPPTKPPRTRMMSLDTSLSKRQTDNIPTITTTTIEDNKPTTSTIKQDSNRTKVDLQKAIRTMKLKNNELTRLNAELQQQLKDVMQSRIAVEMSIHQLRPFSH